jgi:hypothetical protein
VPTTSMSPAARRTAVTNRGFRDRPRGPPVQGIPRGAAPTAAAAPPSDRRATPAARAGSRRAPRRGR